VVWLIGHYPSSSESCRVNNSFPIWIDGISEYFFLVGVLSHHIINQNDEFVFLRISGRLPRQVEDACGRQCHNVDWHWNRHRFHPDIGHIFGLLAVCGHSTRRRLQISEYFDSALHFVLIFHLSRVTIELFHLKFSKIFKFICIYQFFIGFG
jgi:hypothetical protein